MSNPHHPSRPAFPPLQSSTSSSQSSSYSSTSSLTAPTPASSAPLPSPSTMHPQHQAFYGSLHAQSQQHQHRAPQQQPPPVQRQSSYEYQPNRNGAGQTNGETTRFLNQTSLLAEAAKRAQMAVVMRDIEGMEL